MGVLSTYGELKTALTDYSGRGGNTSITANLPTFVRRTHDTLMRELRIPLLQGTADLLINDERIALPADFRAVARLWIDAAYDTPLSPAPVDIRAKIATSNGRARPTVFSIEGGYFAFGPVPDASYTGKLLYYRALTFFASDSATNDLLTRYPYAYLYGALAELYRFDKNDEDEARYEALFRAEIGQINQAEMNDALGGGPLLMTPSVGAALLGGSGASRGDYVSAEPDSGPTTDFSQTLQDGLDY